MCVRWRERGPTMPNDHDDDDADFDADADFDLYEILGDSNAGAYQRVEERTGPPLAYVAEKSRHAIDQIHAVYLQLGDDSSARAEQHAHLSLIHISEPTRLGMISYAVFCLKKKKQKHKTTS